MRSLISAILLAALVVACSTSDGGATSSAETPTEPTGDDSSGDDAGSPEASAPKCSATQCKQGDKCVASEAAACGKNGSACVDCTKSNDGHDCIAGACGCGTSLRCPSGTVCDGFSHKCGPSCQNKPCESGCCSAAGVCNTGTAVDACGASGACLDCTKSPSGTACVAGGKCGCNSAADCGSLRACDLTTHTCTSTCSATQPCNGGCCSAAGTCEGGSSKTACGNTGGACADCSGNPVGTNVCAFASKGGVCGCQTSSDCPTGNSCDPKTHACTTACTPSAAGPLYCNRGCCDPKTSQCATGTASNACGDAPAGYLAICTNCGAADEGPQCLSGTHCGCTGPADCPGRTCSGGKCCSAKGAPCSKGAQCCSGVCAGFGGADTCQ